MHFQPITFGSAEYEEACDFRYRFLRKPLGLELTEQDKSGEESQLHFGLYDQSELIGVLIGKPLTDVGPDVVRLRQVAVHETRRGQGAGLLLMDQAETSLQELGFHRFVLFARADSALFYERCGYQRTGQVEQLIGLEHWEMEKLLKS